MALEDVIQFFGSIIENVLNTGELFYYQWPGFYHIIVGYITW